MRFQKLNGILGHRVIDLFACPLITSVVGEQSRQMVSSLSRYRWVAPWTLVIDWRRETCRDEHPVEWNASLSISPHLSLSLSHDSGPAINSVVNRFHALLPFTEALSSRDYVLFLGFFAKTNLLLCPVIRRVYLCCLFRVSLPPSLSLVYLHTCLSSRFIRREWEFQRDLDCTTLGQLASRGRGDRHTWTYFERKHLV